MIFGRFELEKCKGAVLAHHYRSTKCRIQKGTILQETHLRQLHDEGVVDLIVAQAEPGDLDENEIAELLAPKLAGQGIDISKASTGRVNFKVRQKGIVRYDFERLQAFHLVDEAIGFSVVRHNQLLDAGQMAATLKIIPYFVSEKMAGQFIQAIGDSPLIYFHPLRPKRTALIQTFSPTLKDKVYQATEQVTKDRLSGLDCLLIDTHRCAHDSGILANAIKRARKKGAELILICGGTAITDKADILPDAVLQAGGKIRQIGLAVDPGNMLMAGQIGEVAVIGMPGCARSPKLNGFDLVLHLLLAGIELNRTELARLAAGGLLTEIASRPLPRALIHTPKTDAGLSGLLLAAGQSKRMGPENKLLLPLNGQAVIRHSVSALLEGGIKDLIVVTGHEAEQISACLHDMPVRLVHNDQYESGQASSIRAGIKALPSQTSDVLIALADMPLMTAEFIRAFIAYHLLVSAQYPAVTIPAFPDGEHAEIIRQGNPVIWPSPFFDALAELKGDRGGRQLMGDYPAHIHYFHWPDHQIFQDVDTQDRFAQIARSFSGKRDK